MGLHSERIACVRGLAQAQTRCATCSPQARAFSPPGKTGAVRGPAPGTSRVRARLGKGTNQVRDLLTAGALEEAKEQSSAFRAFLCVTYSRRYPAICQQTDADPETGCMEFNIEKGRFSFRLTAPYSEERRRAASEAAKAAASNLTRSMV